MGGFVCFGACACCTPLDVFVYCCLGDVEAGKGKEIVRFWGSLVACQSVVVGYNCVKVLAVEGI